MRPLARGRNGLVNECITIVIAALDCREAALEVYDRLAPDPPALNPRGL